MAKVFYKASIIIEVEVTNGSIRDQGEILAQEVLLDLEKNLPEKVVFIKKNGKSELCFQSWSEG